MSTTAQNTAPVVRKPLAGTLFMKEQVPLTPKEDGTPRVMGVLQVATDTDVVRVTDFSKQHENLVEGESIRLVYEETQQIRNDRPVTYRNLVSAIQS